MKLLILIFLLFCIVNLTLCSFLSVIIISQDFPLEEDLAKKLENDIKSSKEGREVKTYLTHRDFKNVAGGWSVFPLLKKLEIHKSEFYMIVEPYTKINDEELINYLKTLNSNEELFIGYGLTDKNPVIIHHFYGHDKGSKLIYPDIGAGVVISRGLLLKILKIDETEYELSKFTIDVKFELAKMIYEYTNNILTINPRFCIIKKDDCITWLENLNYTDKNTHFCGSGITNNNVFFAVKTYSGYHRTRLLYIKRTWGKEVKYIEYYSDVEDQYVPTVNLGIPNQERGHCTKSLALLKHALEHEELNDISWFVITDDDTLLSIPRLYRMLNCLPKTKRLILGERYGYGFTFDGLGGYDYPTGGAAMVFSRPAARQMIAMCECPANDSPDDMIIGMCARRFSIPVIHSSAFHQARHIDYSDEYLNRQPPISFHKFEEIDPYTVYSDLLHEVDPFLEQHKKEVWEAQHDSNIKTTETLPTESPHSEL